MRTCLDLVLNVEDWICIKHTFAHFTSRGNVSSCQWKKQDVIVWEAKLFSLMKMVFTRLHCLKSLKKEFYQCERKR